MVGIFEATTFHVRIQQKMVHCTTMILMLLLLLLLMMMMMMMMMMLRRSESVPSDMMIVNMASSYQGLRADALFQEACIRIQQKPRSRRAIATALLTRLIEKPNGSSPIPFAAQAAQSFVQCGVPSLRLR
jgi:uncharacterized membrane protein